MNCKQSIHMPIGLGERNCEKMINRKLYQKSYKLMGIFCTLALLLSGCGKEDSANDVKDTLVETEQISGQGNAAQSLTQMENIGIALLDLEDMFSNRDKEVGYDEATDVLITLQGNSASCNSGAVQINGSTVTITEEGTYILTGELTNGSVVVEAEDSDKIQLVLKDADITCETSAAIYVKTADKVFITLAADTENHLAVTGEFAAIDDNNIDAAIFSKEDLTLNGAGSLQITTAEGHGIVSKDDLVITGGNYHVEATGHGLAGKDSVRIAEGTFDITAGKDGIHSENDDDATLGFVYITDGEYTITVEDDGIHAGAQNVIDGGNINIIKCNEGIEGQTVDIRGGNIALVAEDDGINAASSASASTDTATKGTQKNGKFGGMGGENPFEVDANCYIHISGGKVDVTAGGDGVDSNGGLYVSGGETYVSGPENSANGSIDYAGEGQITGGIFTAAGASGMAQYFGNTSTQGVIIVNLSGKQQSGSGITLKAADGAELITFQPKSSYNCVIVSCPELVQGSSYTLTTGEESQEIEMTSLIYGGNGMGGGMNGGMPGGGRGGMGGFGGGKGDMGGMRGDGQMPNGQMPNGEMPEGEMPWGGRPQGQMPQGSAPQNS